MTRQPSANEVLATLARIGRVPMDDLDGYVVILVSGADVAGTLTNAQDEATVIAILARAIEHRAAVLGRAEAAQ